MQFDNFLNKTIIVTKVKSGLKLNARQKGSIIGLGLRGIGSSSEFTATQSIVGMMRKVAHIIKIEAK